MPESNAQKVHECFTKNLVTKRAKDGNIKEGIALGDCTIMLSLIQMKLSNFEAKLDPVNPGRFRGTKQLEADMQEVLGPVRVHVPKWGASHFRGGLRMDEKRGNKRHIGELIETLNSFNGSSKELYKAYQDCIAAHHSYWEQFSLKVRVQPEDPVQARLIDILSVASLGRVQQGLVYAALSRRYGTCKRVVSKRTFAGDKQSSLKGDSFLGDIQIYDNDKLTIAVEVKSATINKDGWTRVAETHGAHDYDLFLLTSGYQPSQLQGNICRLSRTYAFRLLDFLLTLVFVIANDENKSGNEVMDEILLIYNDRFCDEIEEDPSIRIELIEKSSEATPR